MSRTSRFFQACCSRRKSAALFAILLAVLAVPAVHGQAAGKSSESSAAGQQQTNDSADRSDSPSRELAKESNEADDESQFKHSPSVKFVAKITGLNLNHAYWLCVVLNFAVIAAAIFWAAKKNLPGMFRNRTAEIQKAMQEARKASEDANRRLADIESRLSRLDTEIGTMRSAAEKEAAAEEVRIKQAAEEDARRIVESAEQEIAAATKAARRELTAYAADLAVTLATKQIRVDSPTDQALVRSFAQELLQNGGGPGKARQ
jgi:F-type H+-transporting ATPase subunit b